MGGTARGALLFSIDITIHIGIFFLLVQNKKVLVYSVCTALHLLLRNLDLLHVQLVDCCLHVTVFPENLATRCDHEFDRVLQYYCLVLILLENLVFLLVTDGKRGHVYVSHDVDKVRKS